MANPDNPTTRRNPRGSEVNPPPVAPNPAPTEQPTTTPAGQAIQVVRGSGAAPDAGMALASIAAAYPERFPVLTREQDGDTVRILNAGLGAWEEHSVAAIKSVTLGALKKAQQKFFQGQMAALADKYARGEEE